MRSINNQSVEFDAEGFMTHAGQCSLEIARVLAQEEGIANLTDRHVIGLNFMRKEFAEKGAGPSMMKKEMEKLDIPPVGEFVQMISDAGGHLYACKATVDMFHLKPDDFVPAMERVLTVGDFYELAAGGEIIFT